MGTNSNKAEPDRPTSPTDFISNHFCHYLLAHDTHEGNYLCGIGWEHHDAYQGDHEFIGLDAYIVGFETSGLIEGLIPDED